MGRLLQPFVRRRFPSEQAKSIRQVSHSKSRRPDASHHGPDARASDMEIACIRLTVRTTILLLWTCDRPDDRAHRPDEALKQEKISAKFSKFWSHSCSSKRPMTTFRTAPNFIKLDAHLNPQPINRGP